MLQLYCDESVKDGLLVVGGYISTAGKWAAFSDEWSRLLDMRSPHYPRLDEFHTSEMRNTPERREMAAWYYRVIEDHVDAAVACIVDLRALDDAFSILQLPDWANDLNHFKNPYYSAFSQLIPAVAIARSYNELVEQELGPVDFVFDNSSNKAQCIEGWEGYKKYIMTPRGRSLLGDQPIFRDSATTLPLQAADLWCYWIREWCSRGLKPEEIGELPFEWKPRRLIPILYLRRRTCSEYLKQFHRVLLVSQLLRAGAGRNIYGLNIEFIMGSPAPPEIVRLRRPAEPPNGDDGSSPSGQSS